MRDLKVFSDFFVIATGKLSYTLRIINDLL